MIQDWKKIRDIRNTLLLESDWTQLEDSPLSVTAKKSWKIYRQELRDITNQPIDSSIEEIVPHLVTFPTKPGE
jgi:hypothetical protein